ncbi:TPA: hypothetical protein N0F65_005183 [Lagenidium giganteum]|uniref:tRNA pseudouridine(55) synthase n=1 Tax=Lagenidium giganteum TaxID=4803 RepID=A0AAV2YXC3_9STRA|nr:TPA: hypothetical protein N0F65_005183 [Lagenidium giganteum]
MEERAYDAKSFALAIKLPSAVLVREFAMRHHLRENVERYAGKAAFDLKEAFKGMILAPLSAALNDAECTKTSDLSVTIDLKHDGAADEAQQLPAIKQVEQTKKRRRGPPVVMDGFGAVTRALASLTTLPESVQCPPAVLDTIVTGDVVFEREPVYVQGRYLKYKRGLSQTPWVLEGTRMGSSSVEECIGDVALPFFKGRSYKFHTAGREDVDVRMLGNGRPFILEIIDATRANIADDEWQQIEDAVNKANEGVVAIRQVKMSTKEYFAGLQAGADSKKKTYCCVVWTAGELTPEAVAKLDSIHDLTIQQQTPIRVLHRRTLMTRPKIIHAAKCEVLNKHYMLLRLTTSAGTYVKEFVHGDRGRTVPNVSSILGCGADILQLDVESLIDAE